MYSVLLEQEVSFFIITVGEIDILAFLCGSVMNIDVGIVCGLMGWGGDRFREGMFPVCVVIAFRSVLLQLLQWP